MFRDDDFTFAGTFLRCREGFGTEKALFGICPAPASAADNGNLLGYDEYLGGPGMSNYQPFTQTATYDSVNRLYTMSDNGGWSRTFAYDQWGNMAVSAYTGWTLNVNTPASDPTTIYNASNRRTDSGQYDAAGNVTGLNGYSNLTYDAENRLLTATSPAAFSYGYDGAGRRVVKSGSGGTTVYVYDAGGMLAAEYNTAAVTAACSVCYLSYDQLGSVRLVTDGAGNVVSRHDYLPFGEEVPQGQAGRTAGLGFGGSDGVSQRFTSKERDQESGLDYFGARYYGSALGRFTSPDSPFADQHPEDPQSWNLYSYTRNNPLKFVDDTGTAVIYADEKLRIISDARRQESPSYNTNLSGFEGPHSPDLVIRYGTTANDPDGSPTNGVTSASISPAISTCTSATDCSVTSPAVLKSATITVNDKIAGDVDKTSETLAHEASHGNDARTNPERYSNEKTTDSNGKVIPHDARPVEQRAIGGANQSQQEVRQFKKGHKEEYRQIEKQKTDALKQLHKDGAN